MDYWTELIEIDEDCFFQLRMILFNLRVFHLRLYHIIYHWIHSSDIRSIDRLESIQILFCFELNLRFRAGVLS